MKYRNHPSIIAIQNKCKGKGSFNSIKVGQKQTEKEFLKLDVNKASQISGIPVNILKESTDIFSYFLCNSFISFWYFLEFLNMQILQYK